MLRSQLGFDDQRSDDCPFKDLLDEWDNHCTPIAEGEYEVLSEGNPLLLNEWLQDVRGVQFFDVVAKPIPEIELPAFIPVIAEGSKTIVEGNSLPFVAVMLGDIISPKELLEAKNVRKRFGISSDTKILLLAYGEDPFIERIWTYRKQKDLFRKILDLGFDLVTAINYSIWLDQPHAERLVNLKRSLLVFEEIQCCGINAVPHIYWSGHKDLERWRDWIKSNPCVKTVAINLQTEREEFIWQQTIDDLTYFRSILENPVNFLITGASKPSRIKQLREILPKIILMNSVPFQAAIHWKSLGINTKGKLTSERSNLPQTEMFRLNTELYKGLMK